MENRKCNINVYFDKDIIINKIPVLVQNDYNVIEFDFSFDRAEGYKVFELKKPDSKIWVKEIPSNNKLQLVEFKDEKPLIILDQSGTYYYEISLYDNNQKLTSVSGSFEVTKEAVNVDNDVLSSESRLPILDDLINSCNKIKEDGEYAKKQGDYAKEKATEIVNANKSATDLINKFETDVDEYTKNFNANAQSKQEEYDSNAQSKQESYDTNASRMLEEYNENAKKSKESFDTNVITKTTEFNDNVTQKTSDFNQNVTSKTDEFNSNAYAKTEEFNSNAEQKTNEFNENASSLQEQFSKVVEENEQLNKTISNLPKIKEQTGTDLTLENTSVGYFYHENKKGMRLAGNVKQETTTGKNLLPPSYKYPDKTINGITIKNNNNGSVTITGTATTDFVINSNTPTLKDRLLLKSGSYYQQCAERISLYDSNDNWKENTYKEFSITEPLYIHHLFISFTSGKTYNMTWWYQLEKGTTATEYEPYTGGQPSPNLDYPSDVRVVRGKNQFDKENANIINCYFKNSSLGIMTSHPRQRTLYMPIKINTTYTVQKSNLGSTEARFSIGTTSELPTEGIQVNQIINNTEATDLTITTDKNAKYLVVWYYCTENTEITEEEVLDSIQIEEGSIATKYMPFNTIGIKVMNENFLPFNNQDFIIPNKGIHFYCKDGNLYVDGASIGETSSTTIEFKTYFSFYLYPGIYYFSRGTYKEPIYLRKYDDNSELIVNEGQITIYKKTLVYLGLCIYQQTFSNTMLPIRLEKLPVATTYIPHQEQNYPLSLGDLWLGKIGKYEDYFYKENNEWYLYKIIAKVVLNGSEDWFTLVNLNTSNTSWLQNEDILSDSLSILAISNDYLYCNSFTISNIYNPRTQQGLCYHTDRRVQIRINNDLLDTTSPETIVSSFKTYLSNHRVELYYVLATPKAEKITDTTLIKQLDDLENALSYQGQTNISQDADVPFRISASALYDLNNLIDRVAVLETV